MRKIIHIDMDAFYASVEQRDFPEYRGKPIVVGGEGRRGVVAAASYEARKYGVRSAMAGVIARQKCPELIFVRARFDVYKSVSGQIMEIFHEYTDLVEPMSLDEAYLDVTENKPGILSATKIASEIRQRIKDSTGLTASAGVSFNKFLAKVGSDFNKPDGMTVITPKKARSFIDALPVRKIPGVGKVTEKSLKDIGVFTGADMRKKSRYEMVKHFGKTGDYFYKLIRCEYNSPVVPERIAKSIGAERTFEEDISSEKEMLTALEKITGILIKRIRKKETRGKTVTIKIKYHDFEQHTRSKTLGFYVNPETELFSIVKELFYTPLVPVKPVRLLGVQVSNLEINEDKPESGQLTINF